MEESPNDYLKELKDESAIFGEQLLLPGKKISDLIKKDNYEIKSLTSEGVVLEHKPYFRSEQKKDIEIGYDELVMAFETDHFSIDGFMPTNEGESKNSASLKKVILNTIKNIELKERELALEERERILNETRKEKDEFVETVANKKKSKRLAREIRQEVEFDKAEAQRLHEEEEMEKSFQQEQERLRIEREKSVKLANAMRDSQQQRIRLAVHENHENKKTTTNE
jgi:hypothetical protein